MGDRVLVVFANTLQSAVSDHGRVFRYDGEEFASAPPPTQSQQRNSPSERGAPSPTRREWVVTTTRGSCASPVCSIGVATHTGVTFERVDRLLKVADQGVYAAKAAGRNWVRYSPSEAPNP